MLYIGSDHGGFLLKKSVMAFCQKQAIAFEDNGTFSQDVCDYPVFAKKVAKNVQKSDQHSGLLFCTSGVGMTIAANKFKTVYAACLTTEAAVVKARQHNAINLLCLPGNLDETLAKRLLIAFLSTSQDNAERHERRRNQITEIEQENFV